MKIVLNSKQLVNYGKQLVLPLQAQHYYYGITSSGALYVWHCVAFYLCVNQWRKLLLILEIKNVLKKLASELE